MVGVGARRRRAGGTVKGCGAWEVELGVSLGRPRWAEGCGPAPPSACSRSPASPIGRAEPGGRGLTVGSGWVGMCCPGSCPSRSSPAVARALSLLWGSSMIGVPPRGERAGLDALESWGGGFSVAVWRWTKLMFSFRAALYGTITRTTRRRRGRTGSGCTGVTGRL